jgi:ribonuclease BN (tRNA processing enzyme)
MADNDDIPFNRDFPLKPGVVEEARPGVRRVLCNNPSPFTFTGTVSYIVGQGKVAIIDPGPDDEAHAKALLDAVRGETVTHIFVTHTHRDHSPAVRGALASHSRTWAVGTSRDPSPCEAFCDGPSSARKCSCNAKSTSNLEEASEAPRRSKTAYHSVPL